MCLILLFVVDSFYVVYIVNNVLNEKKFVDVWDINYFRFGNFIELLNLFIIDIVVKDYLMLNGVYDFYIDLEGVCLMELDFFVFMVVIDGFKKSGVYWDLRIFIKEVLLY